MKGFSGIEVVSTIVMDFFDEGALLAMVRLDVVDDEQNDLLLRVQQLLRLSR